MRLKFFAWLTGINLKRTFISTEDFLKLVATAKYLHVQLLNVEWCVKISDLAIFKAKVYLGRLRSINISFNEQLTVLSVACLCSYSSVRGICASLRGLKLEERDLLFLVKTFPRLGNGQTDTLEGDSFLMRWTLFLIYFLKIFDEHLQFVNISENTRQTFAHITPQVIENLVFSFLFCCMLLFCFAQEESRAIRVSDFPRTFEPMVLHVSDISVIANTENNRYFEHTKS